MNIYVYKNKKKKKNRKKEANNIIRNEKTYVIPYKYNTYPQTIHKLRTHVLDTKILKKPKDSTIAFIQLYTIHNDIYPIVNNWGKQYIIEYKKLQEKIQEACKEFHTYDNVNSFITHIRDISKNFNKQNFLNQYIQDTISDVQNTYKFSWFIDIKNEKSDNTIKIHKKLHKSISMVDDLTIYMNLAKNIPNTQQCNDNKILLWEKYLLFCNEQQEIVCNEESIEYLPNTIPYLVTLLQVQFVILGPNTWNALVTINSRLICLRTVQQAVSIQTSLWLKESRQVNEIVHDIGELFLHIYIYIYIWYLFTFTYYMQKLTHLFFPNTWSSWPTNKFQNKLKK